jgi:hypothetical protein
MMSYPWPLPGRACSVAVRYAELAQVLGQGASVLEVEALVHLQAVGCPWEVAPPQRFFRGPLEHLGDQLCGGHGNPSQER